MKMKVSSLLPRAFLLTFYRSRQLKESNLFGEGCMSWSGSPKSSSSSITLKTKNVIFSLKDPLQTRNFHYCYFYTFAFIIHTFFYFFLREDTHFMFPFERWKAEIKKKVQNVLILNEKVKK